MQTSFVVGGLNEDRASTLCGRPSCRRAISLPSAPQRCRLSGQRGHRWPVLAAGVRHALRREHMVVLRWPLAAQPIAILLAAVGTFALVHLVADFAAKPPLSVIGESLLLTWVVLLAYALGLGPGLVASAAAASAPLADLLPALWRGRYHGLTVAFSLPFFALSSTMAIVTVGAARRSLYEPRAGVQQARLRQERQQAGALLQRAVAARETVLAATAHELKGPVTALLLQAENWQRRLGREAVAANAVRQGWKRQAEHLGRLGLLIDRLLDVRRLSGGQLRLRRETFNMCHVVQDVSDRLEPEAGRAQCQVQLHLPAGDSAGRWDRVRVEQVLENLLSNAFKYGGGRPVDVHVQKQGSEVTVRVIDQGDGIGEADQSKIFHCFERAVDPGDKAPGLGLGLWIVQQIVTAEGGQVRVHSALGKGAEFVVTLPCH